MKRSINISPAFTSHSSLVSVAVYLPLLLTPTKSLVQRLRNLKIFVGDGFEWLFCNAFSVLDWLSQVAKSSKKLTTEEKVILVSS